MYLRCDVERGGAAGEGWARAREKGKRSGFVRLAVDSMVLQRGQRGESAAPLRAASGARKPPNWRDGVAAPTPARREWYAGDARMPPRAVPARVTRDDRRLGAQIQNAPMKIPISPRGGGIRVAPQSPREDDLPQISLG